MTHLDYAVLGFYFVYLLTISWVFRKFVHNVSDYFRSGGQVLWWMAGGSAFMLSFSAWTFTGLGIFIRRTPAWSGLSTWLVGFVTGLWTHWHLTLAWALHAFGPPHLNPSKWEHQDWDQAIAAVMIMGVCTAWFCFTRFFYGGASAAYKAAIEKFSRAIETPVDYDKEEPSAATDDKQSWLIGWLCIPYGALIGLISLIRNPLSGRLAFIFCGGLVVLIGTTLVRQSKQAIPTLP